MAGGPMGDLRTIEPYCWTPFKLCVFCNADRYPEGDGYRQEHNQDCPLATLRRHLEPQPIESAPRDGSDVLAFCPIAVAWAIAVFVDGAWVSDTAEHKPTHWLPLPAPANQERRT